MRNSVKWFLVALATVTAFGALGTPCEWPMKRAQIQPLNETADKATTPKVLTMMVRHGNRSEARPSALVLRDDRGRKTTRFEIIAQSDQAGSITYRAQKQTPRGVQMLQVQDRVTADRTSDQFQWEVTMIDEDGVSQKLGGDPRPAFLPGPGYHE